MKVYVSADIEGIAGIAHWDEARPEKREYADLRERMTAHVAAACEGAVAAGATEILVKDAHAHARNVRPERLPSCARLVRGWSGHPLGMVQELDASFDALALVGYHARAGSPGNPLAHTLSSSKVARLSVNGQPASELHLCVWSGAMLDVPLAFVSGDEAICEDARALNPNVHTCPVMTGVGGSTVSLHPEVAEKRIREGMQAALVRDLGTCRVSLPGDFRLEIRYRDHAEAYANAFYPGARQTDAETVAFDHDDFFEILRAITFLV